MSKSIIEKINLSFLYIGIFSFLFLWDIKGNYFEFRYLIILPIFTTFFIYFSSNYKLIKDFGLFIFIFLHLFILGFYFEYSFDLRDAFGLILLSIIFLIIKTNIEIIFNNLKIILNYFIILFTLFYIIFFLYSDSSIILSCYNGWFFRTKFIFLENSHFAIIAVPIINYYSLYFSELKKFNKSNIILFFFAILFLLISYSNFSTTFLVGLALSQSMILFKKFSNSKFFFISIYFIIVCFVTLFGYKQCTERSFGALKPVKEFYSFKKSQNFSDGDFPNTEEFYKNKSKNKMQLSMSVETFLVSLEITKKSFYEKPFGIGFNKYHISHSEYINKILLSDPDIKKNNIMDGSTNLSKLITEFGIFGIIAILILPIFYFRNKKISNIDFFLLSLLSMQFLRGVGYFNGGFLLAYILLFYKMIYLKNLNFRLTKIWQNYKN